MTFHAAPATDRPLPASGRWLAAILLPVFFFALPLSTGATTTAGALLLLGALAFAPWLRFQLMRFDRRLIIAVLLVPMTAILGSVVAFIDDHAPWKVLRLHRKELVFLAVVVFLAATAYHERARRALWVGTFVAAALTAVNWSLERALDGGPFNPVTPVSMTHTFHNFIVGTVSLWMLLSAFERRGERPAWRTAAIAAAGLAGLWTVFFIVSGRSGQLGVLAMLVSLLALRLPKRWLPAMVTVVALLATALLLLPTTFSERINVARAELQAYAVGQQLTSVGLRLTFWKTSVDLIEERPLLGHGTGSYRAVQDARLGVAAHSEKSTPHPHSDLLHFWVERGIAGPLALLLVYLALWRAAARAGSASSRSVMQAAIAGFFLVGLANAFYFDWASGIFLLSLCALMIAPTKASDTAS